MSDTNVYRATARKDGRWWFIEVPELDISGQAPTASEIEEVAHEIAGLALNVEPDGLEVDVTIEIPEPVRQAWAESKARAAHAREEESRAAVLAREAVKILREDGLTQKDAALVLGLSPQRIHQLESGGRRTEREPELV